MSKMANTYTQVYIQFVFAVQNRLSLIKPQWEEELHKYVTGCVTKNNHKLIAINGMEDHLHTLVGLNTRQSLSDLMRIVKGESSEWINKKGYIRGRFQWQEGYGAFSYGQSQLDRIYKYVINQKTHHEKISFEYEYKAFLEKFNVAHEERYLFKKIE
jgi:putative transposase